MTNIGETSAAKTILVVEDEGLLREMESSILEGCGYNILQAESGRKALDLWDSDGDKIDLLLTDITLPRGITGMELAKNLLERQPHLKVVFTSGRVAPELDNGTTARFLQKPYQQSELIQIVRDALTAS